MTTVALQVSHLLEKLEEEDYKMAILYIKFLAEERKKKYGKPGTTKTQVNQLVESLTGILPDSGKPIDEYRMERLGYMRMPIDAKITFEMSSAETDVTREGALQAFKALRAQAKENGVSDMSLDAVNREIDLARKESAE